MVNRTIVAQATPSGESGLAVIRISGPEALSVAQKVFSGLENMPETGSHCAVYGILNSVTADKSGNCRAGDPLDEVIALPMLAPRSFTGEDTIEFFCHGNRFIIAGILKACRMAGAYPASAGEFSQQAFLNGKLSLNQTEAVADLIHADSEHASRAALKQLRGSFNSELGQIEHPLMVLLSQLEGSLEFSDEEDMSVSLSDISTILQEALVNVDRLLALAPAGRLLREGVQVVLAGPPNVGKSSLFNALLKEERALVDDEAGTTRDVISGRIYHGNNLFVFHDTAGLRKNAGRVEQMGIELTHRSIDEADIVLNLNEATTTHKDSGDTIEFYGVVGLNVLTKCDLVAGGVLMDVPTGAIKTSSLAGSGISELWESLERIVASFGINTAVDMGIVLNERHKHKIQTSRQGLAHLDHEVQKMIDSGLTFGSEEIVATLLATVLSSLGEISGRVFSEQLLGSIFRRFCVGK